MRKGQQLLEDDADPDSDPYPQYLNNEFLFVLTQGLHCLLLGFNKKTQRAELISKGYLKDVNCVPREPPYPLFLGPNKKYIALMLSENVLKVIPLVRNAQTKIQLSAAINMRIRHPDVNQIIPLTNLDGPEQHVGVFIQIKRNVASHLPETRNKPQHKLQKYKLDMVE